MKTLDGDDRLTPEERRERDAALSGALTVSCCGVYRTRASGVAVVRRISTWPDDPYPVKGEIRVRGAVRRTLSWSRGGRVSLGGEQPDDLVSLEKKW